jgi:hypothetical protein
VNRSVWRVSVPLATLVVVLAAPPGARADGPIDPARPAAAQIPFRGRLQVQWTDGAGAHTTELDVEASGAAIRLSGPDSVFATPGERMLLDASGWSLLGGGSSGLVQLPAAGDKYRFVRGPGPVVAGRPTTLVEVQASDGESDEWVCLDQATGLLLRRVQFDAGNPVRSVSFVSIDVGARPAVATPTARRVDRFKLLRRASMPAPFAAPASLAGGYRLVATLQRNGSVQAVYSDGIHSLSVFEQVGSLDTRRLPPAAQLVVLGPAHSRRYTWSGGELLTWQAGSTVYTVVGDGQTNDVVAAARSVPGPRALSVFQRVRRVSRQLLREVSGGR